MEASEPESWLEEEEGERDRARVVGGRVRLEGEVVVDLEDEEVVLVFLEGDLVAAAA